MDLSASKGSTSSNVAADPHMYYSSPLSTSYPIIELAYKLCIFVFPGEISIISVPVAFSAAYPRRVVGGSWGGGWGGGCHPGRVSQSMAERESQSFALLFGTRKEPTQARGERANQPKGLNPGPSWFSACQYLSPMLINHKRFLFFVFFSAFIS